MRMFRRGCRSRDREQSHATRSVFGHGEARHGLFGGRGHGDHSHASGEHHGFGRRRGKRFSGDELRLMVLALLEDEPQHGYQLIRSFAAKSGDAYAPSPGVLYPLLTLLADMGLVQELADNTGTSRRSFALSETGRAELAAQRPVAQGALQRLADIAGETRRIDPAPVRRAMMNLRTAAIQRLATRESGGGDASNELAFRIAEIIDAAARSIERLTV